MKTGFFATILLAVFASPLFAAEPMRQTIDRRIEAAWKAHKITPAKPASDAEFLRRVTLDLTGVIPTYDEAVKFLNDPDPKKREKLVDRLLSAPRFAVHQADVWDMVYFGRNPPGFGTQDRDEFQLWLRKQFQDNTPYNVWVNQILRAEGNSVDNGPPMFFVQYRNQPEDATEAITQKFLGIQLQCARCHDHPFDKWSQTDFYGVAAFFARLQVVTVGKKGRTTKYAIGEKNLGDVLFTGPVTEEKVGKKGTPVKPKFPNGSALKEPPLPKGIKDPRNFPSNKMPPKPKFSRKDAFADWVTSADNPYFAKAAVNRVWGQLMGKGIVHPVDNLTKDNPPSHPELLDELTKEFIARKFDLKWLIREIVCSKAYQLSAAGDGTTAMPLWYERARFRPLSAEELTESWIIATGYSDGKKPSLNPDDRFKLRGITWGYMLSYFGRPNDGVGNFKGGMHEHLYLNNGQVHQLISDRPGSLQAEIAKSKSPWEQRVERLFVQILSRKPTPEETKKFTAYLSSDDDPRSRLHDAIWTLMTCSEFRFNH